MQYTENLFLVKHPFIKKYSLLFGRHTRECKISNFSDLTNVIWSLHCLYLSVIVFAFEELKHFFKKCIVIHQCKNLTLAVCHSTEVCIKEA